MYQRSDFHPRQVSHFAGKEGCESLLQPCPNLFRSEFLIHGSPPARRLVTQRGLPTHTSAPQRQHFQMRFDQVEGVLLAKRRQREKRDGGEIRSRGSRRENQPLANYQKLQMNRYAKTSFLQLREEKMPSKVMGRTKVGFAPYRPYPFFRRLAPWPFCGSVAGRLKTPSLLIRYLRDESHR